MSDFNQPTDSRGAGPPNGRELRRAERFRIEAPVEWKLASGGSWAEGMLMDLSVSGAAFKAAGEMDVGVQLTLRISPPSDLQKISETPNRPILIRATVRNVRPMGEGANRFGVEFERLYFLFGEWGRAYEDKGSSETNGKDGQE